MPPLVFPMPMDNTRAPSGPVSCLRFRYPAIVGVMSAICLKFCFWLHSSVFVGRSWSMPGTRWESAFEVFYFILFLPQHPSVIHFRAPDVSGARFPCHRQSLYCKVFEIKNYFSLRLSDLTSSSLKILPPLPPF